jgi:hypothetical protein
VGRRAERFRRCDVSPGHPHAGGAELEGDRDILSTLETPPRGGADLIRVVRPWTQSEAPPHAWGREFCIARASLSERGHSHGRGLGSRASGFHPGPVCHPHEGGAELAWLAVGLVAVGSLPRGWGGGADRHSRIRRCRATPTRVGRRRNVAIGSPLLPIHPHVRGAEALPHGGHVTSAEASPRGWDGVRLTGRVRPYQRDTPTCVGRRPTRSRHPPLITRHPHTGGAYTWPAGLFGITARSPPRAWGRFAGADRTRRRCRGTPTRVGRRGPQVSRRSLTSSHPHAGGAGQPICCRRSAAPRHPHAGGRSCGRGQFGFRGPSHPHMVGPRLSRAPSMRGQESHSHAGGAGEPWPRRFATVCVPPPRVWGGDHRPGRGPEPACATPTRVGRSYQSRIDP